MKTKTKNIDKDLRDEIEKIRDYIIEETTRRIGSKPSQRYDKMYHGSVDKLKSLFQSRLGKLRKEIS